MRGNPIAARMIGEKKEGMKSRYRLGKELAVAKIRTSPRENLEYKLERWGAHPDGGQFGTKLPESWTSGRGGIKVRTRAKNDDLQSEQRKACKKQSVFLGET